MTPEQFASAMKVAAKDVLAPKQLMQEIGDVALTRSRERTPVLTGALRDSEYVMVGDNYATLSTDSEYGPFVHDGTRYMEARPFFRWGIEDALGDIERLAREWGDKILAKVAH